MLKNEISFEKCDSRVLVCPTIRKRRMKYEKKKEMTNQASLLSGFGCWLELSGSSICQPYMEILLPFISRMASCGSNHVSEKKTNTFVIVSPETNVKKFNLLNCSKRTSQDFELATTYVTSVQTYLLFSVHKIMGEKNHNLCCVFLQILRNLHYFSI